ncbi:plantaricin C family lantibiotic [Embleya hyalina]|uniref:Lantibiotic lichenicidin A1 n=1 Tax=Embleya hyalina TaxID=516124 RepID=A0A401YR52_9ACTN|nr:plantaricin C family lantibiotic [Embleya hyalina]GCD97072.1 lantibiotic lichenicidin A1 [Embleya hyalina]
MNPMYEGDISLLEEIADQDLQHDAAYYAGTGSITITTITIFSNDLGNHGNWCTLTKECQRSCN